MKSEEGCPHNGAAVLKGSRLRRTGAPPRSCLKKNRKFVRYIKKMNKKRRESSEKQEETGFAEGENHEHVKYDGIIHEKKGTFSYFKVDQEHRKQGKIRKNWLTLEMKFEQR